MDKKALSQLTEFFSQYKKITYRKGETIMRADDQPQGIYFLTKGYVRIYSIARDGEELTLLLLKEYDFFPVRWAITSEPVRYYYQALTPVQVYRAPKQAFLAFLHENPETFYSFSERIFLRLGALMKRIEYVVFGTSDAKVASILAMCGERFGTIKGKEIVIDLPLTHQDIASLVGMTRETVTHAIDKLKQRGVIRQEKQHIVITDVNALSQESFLQNIE